MVSLQFPHSPCKMCAVRAVHVLCTNAPNEDNERQMDKDGETERKG